VEGKRPREPLGESVRRRRAAQDPAELAVNRQRPTLIQALMASGVRAGAVNRFITVDTDTVLERSITFAVQRLDPPRADFAFPIMGSEAPRGQTPCTDQDNALLCVGPEARQSALAAPRRPRGG